MNKYEIRTQGKKNAIVTAALKLFTERGFVSVSIKEIAALANVSQVSIYNYFNNKEGLVKECTKILIEETLQNARNLLTAKMAFKDKLLSAFSLCSNSLYESLYEYFSSKALDDKVLLNLFTENLKEQQIEIYHDYIELGKQEGVIDHSISTSTILDFLEAIDTIGCQIQHPEMMQTKESEIEKLLLYGLIGR